MKHREWIAVLLVAAVFAGGEGRLGAQTLRASIDASIKKWASIESRHAGSIQPGNTATKTDCNGASVTEKLAFVYALVGGTILLVYGPQEKEGTVWTVDGKSETVAGAVAIGLSFALFRDIRAKKRQ
jgi:hypothetical protein